MELKTLYLIEKDSTDDRQGSGYTCVGDMVVVVRTNNVEDVGEE